MFINPLNVEAFYFNQLPDKIKSIVIDNKITAIISNLEKDKYSKYKEAILSVKNSKSPLQYREHLKTKEITYIINDIINDNLLYDKKGNLFNIVKKNGSHHLYLTKTTSIPVTISEGINYNVYFKNNSNELPTTTLINVKAPNKKIAKEIAFSKFIKNNKRNSSEFLEEFIYEMK